jgi:Rho GDP-dissociation inhibitor
MLGSYYPKGEPYTHDFNPVESPSGKLARSGEYHVRSRLVDDDGQVCAGWLFSSLSDIFLLLKV